VPAGVFHKTDSGDVAGTSRLLFSFDDKLIGERAVEELTKNKFIRTPPKKLYKVKDILNQIEQEEKTQETDYREMQKLLFNQMMILIFRYRETESEKILGEAAVLGQSIAKYISENYDADLSLETLSKKFALSRSHLSRLFKKVTGVGISEYINISRVIAAEKLLTTKKLTVTQVAIACGFNDSNYFAAVFKKIKGITPKKYSMKK